MTSRTSAVPVRVASVPASHAYVRHLADPDDADGIVRLPDPSDPWWPPAMLDPDWLRTNADQFDLLHVHFGFDGVSPGVLDEVGGTLAGLGKPLVVTVHDLRNPHHPTPELHDLQLGALLRHASHVLTLTHDAAAVVARRFGRAAQVVPHPHVVEIDELRRRDTDRAGDVRPLTVGLHLKSLRPNMELGVLDAAVCAVRRVPGARLRVDVHLDVALPDGLRHDADLMCRLDRYADEGAIALCAHDCFDDDQFVEYLGSLRVSVLPYRFGTHSGWLEACRDLGVAVVAPDCGCYRGQGPVHEYACNETSGLDVASCADAIQNALLAPPPSPVPPAERLAQRRSIAAAHAQLYRSLLGGADDVRDR